ncbi:MAG: hypothetical protein IPJ77_19245 [Planctomycetes bacterium]|nr:hypothetical protein [Planctomycetota bacterium]
MGGLAGVPRWFDDAELVALRSLDGRVPRARDVLLRSWIEGEALHLAPSLPADFFDHLDALVLALHARGVCHNDLHKEQNVVVGARGFPELVDFQLASVHARGGRVFAAAARRPAPRRETPAALHALGPRSRRHARARARRGGARAQRSLARVAAHGKTGLQPRDAQPARHARR